MRPPPASRPGRRPVLAFGLLLWALSACEDRDPLGLRKVTRIEIEVPTTSLRPGALMQASATAYNQFGQELEREITWTSRTPVLLAVGATGVARALRPGAAILRASVGKTFSEVEISQVNPPVALLTFAAESVVVPVPGATVPLDLVIEDAEGLPIVGAPLVWSSTAPRIAEVSDSGTVAPAAVGRTTVRASLEALSAAVEVIVAPAPSGTAPLVNTVTPSVVVPGQPVIITGERFGPLPTMNTVLVDGIPLNVTAASTVQLTAVLPLNHGHCLPSADVSLSVSTTGGVGARGVTLRLSPQRTLAVGEALVLETAAESACNELTSSEGRYLVAVSNGARALGAGAIGVTVAGRTATAGSPPPPTEVRWDVSAADAIQRPAWSPRAESARRRLTAHLDLLERTRTALQTYVAPAPGAIPPTASLQMPPLGGLVDVRIPNLDSQNFCQDFIPGVAGRAVFVGDHIVILEDTATAINGAPTLAGQMDALYQALGAEVESVIWPIISQFGNPLVMDDRLDDNGHVFLMFSPRLNAMRGGAVLGAVVNCDFFPRSQLASSNVGEVFYAQVPLNPDPGAGEGTRERWFHDIRTAIAHELKHVVGFGERIVRGRPLEEIWLEEATARIAEELYARVHLGTVQGTNTDYASGVRCEALFGTGVPECDGRPRAVLSHFEGLWTFLDGPSTHSPLGAVSTSDLSFYASGWALTRWVLDHRGLPEAQLLNELTVSDVSGLANLEARAGPLGGWPRIQGRWALAMMLDDRPGLTLPGAPTTFPSWNLADAFAGLCADLGPCDGGTPSHPSFTRAHPLEANVRTAGNFDLSATGIVPGGFVAIDIGGSGTPFRQLVHLRGLNGTSLPATTRLAIVRVQ